MADLLEIPIKNSEESADASPASPTKESAPKEETTAPAKAKAKGRPKGAADRQPRKKRESQEPASKPPPIAERSSKRRVARVPTVSEASSASDTDEEEAYRKAVRVLQARQNSAQVQRRALYNQWVGLLQ